MFNLNISRELIQVELDEIFRRIESANSQVIKEHEANYAWFQIHGMYKLFKLGKHISFSVLEDRYTERYIECETLQTMLEEALVKAERIFDEYCGWPTRNFT